MFSIKTEKRLLQIAIAFGCLVPISAGFCGAFFGVKMLNGGGVDLDSHFRYLSGLLLGIGLIFLSLIPGIEKHSIQARILTFIVVIGGVARLSGLFLAGTPNHAMLAALVMELVITPALYLWQQRIAKLFR